VISNVREFDIHDPERRLKGLSEALAASGVAIQSLPGARSLRRAAIRAEEWFNEGIYPLFRCTPAGLHETKQEAGHVFFVKGDRNILDIPAAAVLNSRKPRRVSPDDKWLIATRQLVEYAIENHMAVVSSFGNLAYSVVSCLSRGSPLIVVCDRILPFMSSEERRTQFEGDYRDLFHSESTLFISSFPPGPLPQRFARCVERDKTVAALASTLLVAEVRPGGNMEAILTTAGKRNIDIFAVDLDSGATPSIGPIFVFPVPAKQKSRSDVTTQQRARGSLIESNRLTNNWTRADLDAQTGEGDESSDTCRQNCTRTCVLTWLSDGAASGYLVHYTRSCPGPWPGQTIAEYCRSLIEGRGDAGHSGFDALNRILRERLIRGSSRMIRGTTPVVSFTERFPHDIAHLIKWRTGLARWTFEPYGIAIRKEALLNLGATQVIYGEEKVYAALPVEERYRFQLVDPACKDWSEEREWRLQGSLGLEVIKLDDIIILVRTVREAAMIEDRFALTGIPVNDFKKTL